MLDDMTSGNSNDPPAPGKPLDIPGFPDVHFEPGGGAGSGARLEEVRDGDEIREIWLVPGNSLPTVGRLWVEAGGEMVSELWLVDVTVRAWGGTLRSAGVAGVATPLPHRMKGHARRLMEACERFTADRGYEISTLFGIRTSITALATPRSARSMKSASTWMRLIARGKVASPLEDVTALADWGGIARLCNAAYAALDGSVVRREGTACCGARWLGSHMARPKHGSDWGQTPRALVGRDVLTGGRSGLCGRRHRVDGRLPGGAVPEMRRRIAVTPRRGIFGDEVAGVAAANPPGSISTRQRDGSARPPSSPTSSCAGWDSLLLAAVRRRGRQWDHPPRQRCGIHRREASSTSSEPCMRRGSSVGLTGHWPRGHPPAT